MNFGGRYRRAQRLADAPNERREVVIEAVYNAIIAPWLSLQPDLQYVVNPGGDPRLRDALVLGVRVKVGR